MGTPKTKHIGIPMTRLTITVATIFAILAIILIGVFVVAWRENDYREMFSTTYWIGSFSTVSHIFVAFGS